MMRQILLVPAMLALILALATALSHPILADPTIRTVDRPLADPALEARARALMREIRCVVCQSQSIDESNADIATNLRNIVREQLAAGKSAAAIRDYLMARYGDFVLLSRRSSWKPHCSGSALSRWRQSALPQPSPSCASMEP